MGSAYPAPVVGSGASTSCDYVPANSATDLNAINVTVTIAPRISSAEIKALAADQGDVSRLSAVPGLGDAAYLDVGIPGTTSDLFVLSGSEGFKVSSGAAPAQLEAVARAVLGE